MAWMSKPIKNSLRIIIFTDALILTAGAMLGPIYAFFVEEVGGSLLDASYAFAAFCLAAGFVTLFSGKLFDRVKENELILVAGYGIMAVGFFGYSLVGNIWQLLIVQVIIGLGEAIYSPARDALFSKHQTDGNRGNEWGVWEAMSYFTSAGGAVVGGLIAFSYGFNEMFYAMALLSIVSALYILILPRDVL